MFPSPPIANTRGATSGLYQWDDEYQGTNAAKGWDLWLSGANYTYRNWFTDTLVPGAAEPNDWGCEDQVSEGQPRHPHATLPPPADCHGILTPPTPHPRPILTTTEMCDYRGDGGDLVFHCVYRYAQ